MYYMKYFDKVVAEIEVIDNIPTSMEILNPKYFFDNYNKNIMNEGEIRQWIKDRLRPDTQSGFIAIIDRLGVDITSHCWYWELFKATHGLNVKDKLYLTEYELAESPWDLILLESNTKINYSKLLNVTYVNNDINMIGACSKELVRLNGKLGILKKSLQHNTYDSVSEEVVYHLANQLGINCSPAICLSSNESISFIDENIDLIHAEDFLKTDICDIEIMYNRLKKTNVDKRVLVDFLRMFLFDILTRQLDRNVTNFGFYKINDYVKLYRLYDNGLSLFSSSNYRESLSFITLYGESLENLKYIVRELRKLNIQEPFPSTIDKQFVIDILSPFEDIILEKKSNNSIENISDWVMRMYNKILEEFSDNLK